MYIYRSMIAEVLLWLGCGGFGVLFPAGARAPENPDSLWFPPTLLFIGYLCPFFGNKVTRGMKLTICLHLVLKLRMWAVTAHFPTCLFGVVLN